MIFDFNGVLLTTNPSISPCSATSSRRREGASPRRDYHDRYLGFDDRGCFEPGLIDAGQSSRPAAARRADRPARRARYVAVAEAGLRFFPRRPETLSALASRWPVAICSGALRPEIEFALRRLRPARPDRGHHFGQGPRTSASRIPAGLLAVPRRAADSHSGKVSIHRRHGPGSPRVPGRRGQPGRNRLGQGSRHVGDWRRPHV